MPKNVWTILCSKSSIDQTSNNISLFEVVEEIRLRGISETEKIVISTSLQLITLWIRENIDIPENVLARFLVRLPSGEKLTAAEFKIDLTNTLRHRHIINIMSLPIHGEGLYQFIVELLESEEKWTEITKLPISVSISNPAN